MGPKRSRTAHYRDVWLGVKLAVCRNRPTDSVNWATYAHCVLKDAASLREVRAIAGEGAPKTVVSICRTPVVHSP